MSLVVLSGDLKSVVLELTTVVGIYCVVVVTESFGKSVVVVCCGGTRLVVVGIGYVVVTASVTVVGDTVVVWVG